MKCHCGYEGIPTVHHEDPANPRPEFARHPHHWKCPACHAPRPADLRHDWQRDTGATDWVCSQCGMRAETDAEDRTPCPGHGANWTRQLAWCLCGEWGPAPQGPHPATLPCKRCGQPYPHYAPAQPGKRDMAGLEMRLRALEALLAERAGA